MTSYEYTIYELHYYVEHTHKDNDGSMNVHTGDEHIRIFSTMDELEDTIEDLKERYDGQEEIHSYGTTSKRLSKATYIEARTTKRIFAVV